MKENEMLADSLERQIHVDAAPEVVYQVVSSPEHLRRWWPDTATFESAPGATGVIGFGDKTEALTVLETDPPRRFSFCWVADPGVTPAPENALTVTFDLSPDGTGTLLRFTESGYRTRGWDDAVAEDAYADHAKGWDHFLPRLVAYAPTV